jgi:hypothetical protein
MFASKIGPGLQWRRVAPIFGCERLISFGQDAAS